MLADDEAPTTGRDVLMTISTTSSEKLPDRHRAALAWFSERRGQVIGWPSPIVLSDGEKTFLATKAKGIYKPRWTHYALSIREMLDSPYNDLEPIRRADGSWTYLYFQEGHDPEDVERLFTNRGLVACMADKVPVAVMRQVPSRGPVQYEVLGLALVTRWAEGRFTLEGLNADGNVQSRPGPAAEIEVLSEGAQAEAESAPDDAFDGRRRIVASIVARQGQQAFRAALVKAYNGQCAMTGTDVLPALEAAHITPYAGPHTNRVENGLLLRADLHTLFDVGLVSVDAPTHRVLLAATLVDTAYEPLRGSQLRLPLQSALRPDPAYLNAQREWAGL
jgi:hypothetical protein